MTATTDQSVNFDYSLTYDKGRTLPWELQCEGMTGKGRTSGEAIADWNRKYSI